MSQLADELVLDRLVHEPGRLAILTVLSSVAEGRRRIAAHWEQLERLKRLGT